MTNYKPYSPEWSRKRYLAEAIQTYFNDDVSVQVILNDIVDILEESAFNARSRADKFQEVLDGLKA